MGTNWEGQVKILPLHVFWTCRAEARPISIYLIFRCYSYPFQLSGRLGRFREVLAKQGLVSAAAEVHQIKEPGLIEEIYTKCLGLGMSVGTFRTLCDLCDLLFRNFLGVFLSQSLPGRCALFGRRRRISFTEDRKDHKDNPCDVTVAFQRYFFGVRPRPDRGDRSSSLQ